MCMIFQDIIILNGFKKCKIDESEVKQILNINAGFDETSFIIKNNFPNADLNVFDFYDAEIHTEPAIVRARKVRSGLSQHATNEIKLNGDKRSFC